MENSYYIIIFVAATTYLLFRNFAHEKKLVDLEVKIQFMREKVDRVSNDRQIK